MRYNKEYIQALDKDTLNFCVAWLSDTVKRQALVNANLKTKAKRDYAQAVNHGLQWGRDMLRILQDYNNGTREMAQTIEL